MVAELIKEKESGAVPTNQTIEEEEEHGYECACCRKVPLTKHRSLLDRVGSTLGMIPEDGGPTLATFYSAYSRHSFLGGGPSRPPSTIHRHSSFGDELKEETERDVQEEEEDEEQEEDDFLECVSMMPTRETSTPGASRFLRSYSSLPLDFMSCIASKEGVVEDEEAQPVADMVVTPLALLFGHPVKYHHVKLPIKKVQQYIEKWGSHWFAHSHQHKKLYHFEIPDVGLVSYTYVRTFLGPLAVVPADPIAAPGKMKELLEGFHETIPGDKQYMVVSEVVAQALRELGFTTTLVGMDHWVSLKDWKLPGRCRLMKNYKHGITEGLVLKEQKWAEVDAERVREVSNAWFKGRGIASQELEYVSWPLVEGDEWNVRKFYCYNKEGQLLAFIYYTGCYRDGKVIGWVPNACRRDPDSQPTYALDFINMKCAEIFKAEGAEYLTIGPALLQDIQHVEGGGPLVHKVLKMTYDAPNIMYPYKNVGDHKNRYRANQISRLYICAKGFKSNAQVLVTTMTVGNMFPPALFYGSIFATIILLCLMTYGMTHLVARFL